MPRIACAGFYLNSVTLWHGTTKSAAERIVDQGFDPADTAAIVGAVARDHGLAGTDLLMALKSRWQIRGSTRSTRRCGVVCNEPRKC
jgi:hypothetical protein